MYLAGTTLLRWLNSTSAAAGTTARAAVLSAVRSIRAPLLSVVAVITSNCRWSRVALSMNSRPSVTRFPHAQACGQCLGRHRLPSVVQVPRRSRSTCSACCRLYLGRTVCRKSAHRSSQLPKVCGADWESVGQPGHRDSRCHSSSRDGVGPSVHRIWKVDGLQDVRAHCRVDLHGSNSAGVSGPGLLKMYSGTASLPVS